MSRWRIELVGRDEAFEVDEGTSLLDGARAAGIRIPFGCGYGSCCNCAARLLEGSVDMPGGTSLPPGAGAQGIFLLCVAEARSDLRIEVGPGAMGILDVTPWQGGG